MNTQSPDTPDPHTQKRHRVCLRHTERYRTNVTFCERVIMQMGAPRNGAKTREQFGENRIRANFSKRISTVRKTTREFKVCESQRYIMRPLENAKCVRKSTFERRRVESVRLSVK